jgi:hypothetical protein
MVQNMTGELKHFADVRAGHPFRGSVPEAKGGTVPAIQMRDVSPSRGVDWAGVVRTTLEGRKEPDWLQPGDILFVARGTRNFAVCLDDVPAAAVCSQYFFLVRVRDTHALLPKFLAWQINQLPAQRYLGKNAEGTDQLSIRRGVLEALPIAVPPMEQQHRLMALANAARHERDLLENLILNREQQLQALVLKLLSTD